LARTLQVSQATVREALVQLEQFGLVVRIPNKGTTVTNLSSQEVRHRLRVRMVLEELAAVEAAPRLSQEEFLELEDYAGKIAEAIAADSYFDLSQADLHFHRFIWEKSANPVLYRMLDQLTTPLFAFLGILHKISSRDQRKTKPHEHIIDALRSQDPELVRAAIRYHIEGSYSQFLDSDAADLQSLVVASATP